MEKKLQKCKIWKESPASLICNASPPPPPPPPGTACIMPLCRVSPFNGFMSLAFFGAKEMKRGYSLLKNSLWKNECSKQDSKVYCTAVLLWYKGRPNYKAKTSTMERFANIVNGWKPLTISTKHAILYVWQGSEYNSGIWQSCQTTIKQELTSVFSALYTIALLVCIASASTLL